ncbi:NAD-dependent epimerase/dehydratase family protein [Aquibium sp. A9E412]|uniref:NAD-dependent epimerase/dehydratase family protein n=1 Tax=Aquibium sp. A9E412 TaxID=2976767 RepID=UPI0025B251F6|nr:NAD-dependent epimerase/dehydratase family protein [Aquibium sp. A9E412]MDN2566903.1 NAD-dependent epimerase/dehydratase family protein [Aquibium sp. A9E412]
MTPLAVTGASGFLGRHVLAALDARAVAAVAQARRPVQEQAPAHRRWTRFDMSLDPAEAYARLGRPQVVVHLAWEGLPNYLSLRHFEVELPAQYRFLSGLVAAGVRRLVVAGTCFEYGMRSGPLAETLEPQPANPYGFAKDALRRQLGFLAAERPFELRWLRLFYLYGPGQAPTSLFGAFQAALARGDAQFDMSAGEQLRDFMPAEDAGAAIAAVALAAQAPAIVNVCSGRPRSVRGLVEDWRAAAGSAIALNLGARAYPSYEPFAFWGDGRRLAALQAAPDLASNETGGTARPEGRNDHV